jgi:hypothetical protein
MALALLGTLPAQAVHVEGALGCPAAEEVAARLDGLLAPAVAGPVDRARLERHGGFVRLSLLRADDSLLADRFLDGGQPCADLAAAAAAIIASWQTGHGTEAIRPLPAVAVIEGAAPGPERAPAARRFDLGLGAGGSLAEAGPLPAVMLSAAWLAAGGDLGARATLMASGTRTGSVGTGALRWQRLPLALGPLMRWQPGRVRIDAHLGGAAALTRLAGQGFATNRRHVDLELGAAGGLRVAWARAGLQPWIEVLGSFWPVPAVGFEETRGAAARPDRAEVFLVLGLSWAR